jgi:tripartite ATP-independent transporter DctM subunit
MMATVLVYAKLRGYPIYKRASAKEFIQAFAEAFLALVTPAIIIGGIVGGFFTATEASVVAVVYSALLGGVVYRSIGIREFPKVFYESARFASISLFCIGTATAFGWLLAYFRIPQSIVEVVAGWGAGRTGTGFLIAAAFLFVGMFIDAIPAIIVVGTVFLPLAEQVEMDPIHFAMIGVISLAFGLVTPPYGLCLLISCSLGEIKMIAALKDVAIVLAPMLALLVFVIVFPDIVLFLPRTLGPNMM